jgi:hypothetical protein
MKTYSLILKKKEILKHLSKQVYLKMMDILNQTPINPISKNKRNPRV